MGISAGSAPGGAQSPAGGDLVWEWNGLDVSQFDTGNPYVEDSVAQGRITSIGIDVEAQPLVPGGNVLRLRALTYGGGGNGSAIMLVTDPLPSAKIRWEFDVYDQDANGCGLAFFCDSQGDAQNDLYAVAQSLVGTTHLWTVEAGDVTPSGAPTYGGIGTAPMGVNVRAALVSVLRGEKPPGGPPRGMLGSISTYRFHSNHVLTMSNIPNAFGAGWNPLAANRWGLAMYTGAGSTTGPWRISGLRVFDLSTA